MHVKGLQYTPDIYLSKNGGGSFSVWSQLLACEFDQNFETRDILHINSKEPNKNQDERKDIDKNMENSNEHVEVSSSESDDDLSPNWNVIEKNLEDSKFIKENQSCAPKVRKIKKFHFYYLPSMNF